MKLDQRCKAINDLALKHAKGEVKQEQYLIAIGKHIAAIKEEYPDKWETIVEERCSIKRSRAYELMAIANGTMTVEQLRLKKAESMRRARSARPQRGGQDKDADGEEAEAEDDAEELEAAAEPPRAAATAIRQLVRFEIMVPVDSVHEIDLYTCRPGSGREEVIERAVDEFCSDLRRKRLKREARQRERYEQAMTENHNRDEQHRKYNMAMAEKRAA
jgi:hypothetical protein